MVNVKPKLEDTRRYQIAVFFRERRIQAGLTEMQVVRDLGLESVELLREYEAGTTPIPLDDVFTLTNLLNIPPEDVMALIYDVYSQGSF